MVKVGARAISLGVILAAAGVSFGSCSLVVTRPVQLMSDTSAAIKAAHEVQADTLAPELYRQSTEWYFKARQEYKLKNYKQATEYATRAKHFAEQAEFQVLRNGGKAAEPPPPPEPPAKPPEYQYPTPTPTPADVYEKRRAEEEAAKKQAPSEPQLRPLRESQGSTQQPIQ